MQYKRAVAAKAAAEKMSADIKEYYNNTLDWDKNISEFIKHI